MNRGSTLFLKFVISLIALVVVAVCVIGLPQLFLENNAAYPEETTLLYPFLAYVYASAIPFLIALLQAFKLLNYIDENKVFSEAAVQAVRVIKICAVLIGVFVVTGSCVILFLMSGDRAHFASIGFFLTFAAVVTATAAAVLQKLVQNVVDIKSENDLTV